MLRRYHGTKRRITLVNDAPLSDDVWSLDRPNARRSLILCAAGALIGLGIAGLGLFTAQGTRTASVPAEDVALVNQVPILTMFSSSARFMTCRSASLLLRNGTRRWPT
jgi:hypothetical protein